MSIDALAERSRLGRKLVARIALGLATAALGALMAAPAPAQEPDAKAAPPAPGDGAIEALSLHYRFTERYSPTPDPNHPESITQYQVGVRETTKTERENPTGAPTRGEMVRHMMYTERVAKTSRLGDLTDAVRRYDRFFFKDYTAKNEVLPPSHQGAFQGLTVWLHEQPAQSLELLNLTPERPIREFEYAAMIEQPSLPRLKGLLPPAPSRIGDTWSIPIQSSVVLLGQPPEAEGYSIEGSLIEVHKAKEGTNQEAVIGVQGQFKTLDGPSAINTRITFSFASPPVKPAGDAAEPPTPRGRTHSGVVEARGQITEVRMARVVTAPVPEGDGRLQQRVFHELLLGRRPTPVAAGADPATALIPLPEAQPKPDEANSWILYDDPAGRFHLRHPQNLKLNPGRSDPADVEFLESHEDHADILGVQLQPKDPSPERDRLFRDPEYHHRLLLADWAKKGLEVVKGPFGWLPEAAWTPFKRKVYRIEAALQPQGKDPGSKRVYSDYYLVLLPANQSIFVTAMTMQDPHVPFRDQAESVIKSFEFGPSRPANARAK